VDPAEVAKYPAEVWAHVALEVHRPPELKVPGEHLTPFGEPMTTLLTTVVVPKVNVLGSAPVSTAVESRSEYVP
jgi:hypothetical protein